MPQTSEQRNQSVAAASSCPALDCGSLVLDYRPTDSLELGHPEALEFTCSRCGTEASLMFEAVAQTSERNPVFLDPAPV